MEDFFNFLENHYIGFLILILFLFSLMLCLRWVAQIFKIGKYKQSGGKENDLTYIITMFFSNLINDFRHFLALMIVLIFLTLTIYAMMVGPTFDNKMEALQLVIASLGGLLGSIIGYYFGESAGAKNRETIVTGEAETETQLNDHLENNVEEIVAAPEFEIDEPE